MRSLIDFLKYHNAVPVIIAVLVLGTGVVFAANPAVRETFFPADSGPIGPAPAPENQILQMTDIGDFDMAFRVDSIREVADSYQITYSYRTLEVIDRAWQVVPKAKIMDIPKALLGKRDLGLYAAEQIGQVMDREISYLSEVQARLTDASPAGDDAGRYNRLAGKTLDPKDREFNGYKPVVKGEEEEKPTPSVTVVNLPGQESPVQTTLSKEEVRQIIIDSIANFLSIDAAPAVPASAGPATVPVEVHPAETVVPTEESNEVDESTEAASEEPETTVLEEENPSE